MFGGKMGDIMSLMKNAKNIEKMMEKKKRFGGLPLDPVLFGAHVSFAQLPQGATNSKKSDHLTTTGSPTRDPTRPGPQAWRISLKLLVL